jgi:hypothetical protein
MEFSTKRIWWLMGWGCIKIKQQKTFFITFSLFFNLEINIEIK